jgi:hypothetical protein
MLRVERVAARVAAQAGPERFENRVHQAQIASRRVLQALGQRLEVRGTERGERERLMASAAHAAELQLPDSWLPDVVTTAAPARPVTPATPAATRSRSIA